VPDGASSASSNASSTAPRSTRAFSAANQTTASSTAPIVGAIVDDAQNNTSQNNTSQNNTSQNSAPSQNAARPTTIMTVQSFDADVQEQTKRTEIAALGAIMYAPDRLPLLLRHVSPDDLYWYRHKIILEAMVALFERSVRIDTITLGEELTQRKALSEIGGQAFIASMMQSVPDTSMLEVYAQLIKATATRRKMMQASDAIRQSVADASRTTDQLLADAYGSITSLMDAHATSEQGSLVDLSDLVMDDIRERVADPSASGVVYSGIKALDSITDGWMRGEFILFAARTKVGKSAVVLQSALNMIRAGKRVLYITSELTRKATAMRILSNLSGVPQKKMLNPRYMTTDESKRLSLANMELAAGIGDMMQVEYLSTPSGSEIEIAISAAQMRDGVDCVIFDGMHRASPNRKAGRPTTSSVDATKYIADDLADAAARTNVPLVCVHQLNRNNTNRADKRPVVTDLFQGGETVVDQLILLYRDELENEMTDRPDTIDFIVALNRRGDVGTAYAHFDKPSQRITDAMMRTDSFD